MATIGDLTDETVDRTGPASSEFIYVDIGSVDREQKYISDAKVVESSAAPSRAKQVLQSGDVLISMTRPNLNAIAMVTPEFQGAIGSTGFHILRSKQVESKFLFYLVQTRKFIEEMCLCVQGALYPAVRPKDISSFVFQLAPINEQHRIVAKIEELFSELDKGIDSLKTARAQLKVYRQALLKHAFEGKLTAQWREQRVVTPAQAGVQPLNDMDSRLRGNDEMGGGNDEPLETAAALLKRIQQERAQRYQQQLADWEAAGKPGGKPKAPKSLPPLTAEELAELPELPEGWGWEKNENFLCEVKDGTHDTPRYVAAGIPFVTQKNIRDGKLDLTDIAFISEEDHARFSKRSNVENGDVIISMIGHGRGQCCIVNTDTVFSIKNVGLFKFFDEFQSNKYLCFYYQSKIGLDLVLATSKGGAQPFIGLTELRNWPVPICSFAEQHRIVEELESKISEADQLDQTLTASLQQAEALRQSILKKAFSGQLVAQDANDEPAAVLLARIKAEKAAQTAMAKPRKQQKAQAQPAPAKTNVIPFPVKIANISATDLHAGILALAYQHHEQNSKYLACFGHVKAEKIGHLVEAHLGIDLERVPVKDAAGPNDYPHLKKVESRARKANWFEVRQQQTGAYAFSKKHGFDALLDRTTNALGKRVADVDALLKLLLPLNTRQAEIVATLYAAWNNLLLLGRSPEDEDIVYEARESWHESKLKIDREKFFKGLEWMRNQGLVPAGRGRYVAEKGKQPKSGEVKHD